MNSIRYTKEDLLHWEHNPNRQCLQVKNRYDIAVMSITDFAYHSQSKRDQLNKCMLYKETENYFQMQCDRIKEETI